MTAGISAGGSNLFRYQQLLTAVLAYRGGEPLEALAPELLAVLPLDADRLWNAVLRQERPISYEQTAIGDATHPGQVSIQNPSGSGILCLVEGIIVENRDAAAQLILWGLAFNAVPAAYDIGGTPLARDGRLQGNSAIVAGQSTTQARRGQTVGAITLPPSSGIYIPYEVVLPEKGEMTVSGVVAKAIAATFIVRERAAEVGEKRFF